jgi:CDP-diacylglycerol--serine O-phosphatidyltransferase
MKKRKIKLNYILPNLFTAASIFVAIISIVSSTAGNYEKGAWLIVMSLFLDGLDGKIARLTKGESKFGVEFDSLADIVAFGVAPAMLIYMQIGKDYGKFGILAAALFVVLGAVRLARFNITTHSIDSSLFIGLPIPSAALALVSISLLESKYNIVFLEPVALVVSLVVALLMVSNIRYFSLKKVSLSKGISFRVLVALVLLASLIYLYPIESINIIFFIYIASGPIRAIWAMHRFGKI